MIPTAPRDAWRALLIASGSAMIFATLWLLDNIQKSAIVQTTPALSYYILKYLLFEYFLINDLSEIDNYNLLIKKITAIGLVKQSYIKLNSSRMSLLQLN